MIIPRLWLGNYRAAKDVAFLKKNRIDIIVNCTPDIPFSDQVLKDDDLQFVRGIHSVRIPVYDSLSETDFILMEQHFAFVLPYLTQKYAEGRNILVHCHAGKQRSAIVVAAFLYYTWSSSIPDDNQQLQHYIFSLIHARRPQAFMYGFRVNFMKSFQRFFQINSQ
jgi:protein tyrosine phosphatase